MNTHNGGFACPEQEAALQALVFGELEQVDKEAVLHHLEVCPRCRRALEDARRGFQALSSLEDVPLPYSERETAGHPRPEAAWVGFQKRLRLRDAVEQVGSERLSIPRWKIYRVAAAAALLIAGFVAGRWREPRQGLVFPETASPAASQAGRVEGLEVPRVDADAVEALARAELLSDVGLRYVTGLQDLLNEVLQVSGGAASDGDLGLTREQARELIRDGRLLKRSLDPDKDQMFLATIHGAELFLEELAAVEADAADGDIRIVQASLRNSRLPDRISALDIENKVAMALEASGWIGEELVERKEF